MNLAKDRCHVGEIGDRPRFLVSSVSHIALGEANRYLTPHPLYLALGKDAQARQTAYQDLFREPLDDETISDIRLTRNQNQPLGNHRCFARIEAMTGQRSNPTPRGRPKKQPDEAAAQEAGQTEWPL